ncbi:hypothetical protein [Halorientalis marina]|uniref:hypothetical protein n=1 Tax=Halorientalis marina TaxID=2931976 RepID=UPI001FF36D93|nr:hypothetical protein [Halorientalis marina]
MFPLATPAASRIPDWTDYPVGIESAVVAGERLSERAIALGSQSNADPRRTRVKALPPDV